ncbi:MAG: hypothetical protein ACE5JB_00085 [bacterium]
MFLFRLLLYGLLFYFAYKIVSYLFSGGEKKIDVKGSRKGHPPLDLHNEDVEDANFEELNNTPE